MPGEQPISSPFHTSKHSPRGEKRSNIFRTPSILLYLLRNPSPNQCESLQSPSLANTHKRKSPPNGSTNTFQKPSPPKPSNWHQNHKGRERGLVFQTGHGRTDPTHSNQARGERSETQTPVEGPTQPRMELARGAKQGRI
jgi:hypothetical protein